MRQRRHDRRRCLTGAIVARSATALLGMTLAVSPAEGQAGRDRVREGNRLYDEGRFAEAHQKYLEAMAEAPDAPIIPFNDGNALYQTTDYQRAMEAYQRAIEAGDPALASSAWYNLGNTLYRQQQLQQSLEAFKQALRLNPQDGDAKHNLERVLEQMQEQQQQENDESQDEQDEDEEDQQEQEDQEQDPQQDQDSPEGGEDEDEQDESPPQGEEPQEEGQEPQQNEMTQEEAERLLDAIEEDPEDVNRKRLSARGRRPKKPW